MPTGRRSRRRRPKRAAAVDDRRRPQGRRSTRCPTSSARPCGCATSRTSRIRKSPKMLVVPIGTVMSRISRGRKLLHAALSARTAPSRRGPTGKGTGMTPRPFPSPFELSPDGGAAASLRGRRGPARHGRRRRGAPGAVRRLPAGGAPPSARCGPLLVSRRAPLAESRPTGSPPTCAVPVAAAAAGRLVGRGGRRSPPPPRSCWPWSAGSRGPRGGRRCCWQRSSRSTTQMLRHRRRRPRPPDDARCAPGGVP